MDAKTKILIVDDEPINLEFFEVMLSKLGFEVIRAGDGEEALEKVQDYNPDLIILDNIMPKLTGWKVTRLLKNDEAFSDYSSIPIIMFSAMDDVKDKIEGFELGVEDYITKPFNFSEVLARIRAVLRGRELSKQLMEKERQMVTVESLNNSLIYFSQKLKEPVNELLEGSKSLDVNDPEAVKLFVGKVQDENERIAASLEGLQAEIKDLQDKDFSTDATLLEDLEKKFKQYFDSQKKQSKPSEVEK